MCEWPVKHYMLSRERWTHYMATDWQEAMRYVIQMDIGVTVSSGPPFRQDTNGDESHLRESGGRDYRRTSPCYCAKPQTLADRDSRPPLLGVSEWSQDQQIPLLGFRSRFVKLFYITGDPAIAP